MRYSGAKIVGALLAAMVLVGSINPELLSRFQALQAAAQRAGTHIGIGSGYRTVEQQAALRRTNGCPDVWTSPASSCRIPTAIPGRSNHNHGLAIDITGDKAWANANAARFGLHFPIQGEDWHLEMIGDEGSSGHMHDAEHRGAIGFDLEWADKPANPEDELSARLDSVMKILTGGDFGAGTPEEMLAGQEVPTHTDVTVEQPAGAAGATGTPGPWQGGVPPPGYNPPGEGAERWRDVAIAALRYTGQDPGQVDILLRRLNQESGGNPFAVNNWDSNARRGDPTTGLMQNIPSAFADRAQELAGRGITDGFANIVASIRYTLQRYGSLAAGWNRRGGY